MNEMEYETYTTGEYKTYTTADYAWPKIEYFKTIKARPEVIDLERRIVFMEKQIQQLKHRIAELELRGL